MKPTNTVAKLFRSVSTLAVVAGAVALNGVAWGQGAVLAWGYNFNGACNIPTSALRGVTAIAGGYKHTIALKDGAVLAWGNNDYGRCNIPDAANSGVSAIAGGGEHTIALKDGAVLAWGNNSYGQCNGTDGSGRTIRIQSGDGTVPVQINGVTLTGVSAIAGGQYHTIALKNGAVLAWGRNDGGECSGTDNLGKPITTPDFGGYVQIMGKVFFGVSAIAGGGEHTIALKDGAVLAWGLNNYGQCNVPAAALSGVTAIVGGLYHTIALKDGAVLAWGRNWYGQCNGTDGSGNSIGSKSGDGTVPVQINGVTLTGVSAIAGGYDYTIALKDGAVLFWGLNNYGQFNVPASAQSGISAIAGGFAHLIALTLIGFPCSADFDGSGFVDSGDLGKVLLDIGECGGCSSDLDGSGLVDSSDVGTVLLNFGPCQGASLTSPQKQEPLIFQSAETPVLNKK